MSCSPGLTQQMHKYFFDHKYHDRKPQNPKQYKGAEFTGVRLFGQIPDDKKHKNNQTAATQVHSPGFKLLNSHNRLRPLVKGTGFKGAPL